ncbi:hypothetical protein [Nannocystis pusilla]|uniref:hypothetical protein n=1 Tax=Nannocystis pusilla TaxID=889268 RepID=UPI003B7F2D09
MAGLLTLPQVPGALEAAARALARGLTRALPGSAAAPVFFALDFRGSRARPFPDLLRRAQLVAADPSGALRLDVLRVDGKPAYRLSFGQTRSRRAPAPSSPAPAPPTSRCSTAASRASAAPACG